MIGDIFTGQRGMAPLVFFVTVAWALFAVLLLTGTLLAARDIDHQVKGAITPELGRIGKDTQAIALTNKTVDVSGAILKAAAPLTGQAGQVIKAATSIDTTAKSINSLVKPINASVRSIQSKADGIHTTVLAINSNVKDINASVHSIYGSATSINSRLHTVLGDVGNILSTATHIDGLVSRINGQAATVIDIAKTQGILPDFDGILGYVGDGSAAAHSKNTVDGHANSIDCARLLNALGKNAACNKFR